MPQSSTVVLHGVHDPDNALWPASDVFSDDTFGTQDNGDTRLCQRPPGAPVGDHVRLVRVSSVRPDGILCCETCISSLDYPETYTAISYTWGSPLAHRLVVLDGREHLVTENLWRFLKHAVGSEKYRPGSGWLWIDALSIDQRSPRERTYQVGIMANIFGRAERVVVWLGPAYNNSGEAMKALSASVRQLQHVGAPPLAWTKLAGSAFVSLCKRAYWQRIWVFQELKAGRDIHLMCGNSVVPCGNARTDLWRLFIHFLSYDDARGRLPRQESAAEAVRRSPAWDMVRHISLTSIDRVQTTLWTLLISTQNLRCANAHDRVYALLSISTSGHQGISADYAISIQCLLNRILRNWHSYLRPSSLNEVSRQCRLLQDMFSLNHNSMYIRSSPDTSESDFNIDRLQDTERKQKDYEQAKIWAEFYGHTEVCRLLQAESKIKYRLKRQSQDDFLSSRVSTTTTASTQSSERRAQVATQESACESAVGGACTPAFGRWVHQFCLRFSKRKRAWKHEP